ncbi:class I SAM-dependent methyltransferase [candidate division WOR-3 bacterium]|nr:class I SAM-dependent methyltransferase [candidate division WOR-3 bacterium]
MALKELSVEEGKKNYWGLLLIQRELLKELLSRQFELKEHLDILEVGCYKGMLVGWLHENFPKEKFSWDYVGIDIIEPPDRRKDYPHYVMNAEVLEFNPNSFDAVIMIEVLEHIVDYVRALREVYRVLRPNGLIFIQSVICTDKCALADQTHFHVLHPKTLERLMKFLGFKNIEYIESCNFAIYGYK